MTIEARISEAEQKFNTKQAEKDNYLKLAEECQTEMTKLQGEWRVLNELLEVVSEPDPASVVEVKPERKKK